MNRRHEDEVNPLVVVVFIVFSLVVAALLVMASCSTPEREPRMDALTQTYTSTSGETVEVYVVTDPDTNIQYLVTDSGGLTPRLGNLNG
jgi:hypothetical protein